MANRIGAQVTINGMRYTISDVNLTGERKPVIVLTREFDKSLWYAKCNNVTRFTHIMRIPDKAHANLDHYDAVTTLDAIIRRL